MEFEHQNPDGTWEPYSKEQDALIADAFTRDANGRVGLPGLPFELRFGTAAVSARRRVAPASGIIQVNTRNENTRIVRRRDKPVVTGTVANAAVTKPPSASFSHRAHDAVWEPYAPAQNELIAAAVSKSPERGALPLRPWPARVEAETAAVETKWAK